MPLSVPSHTDISMLLSPRTTSSPVSIRGQLSVDPLLANLSPSSLLEALRTNDATLPASASKGQFLQDSISEASPHERALGIRAALAGKRIKEWVTELQGWTWPEEIFQPPTNDLHDEYWGSLPSGVVRERENHLEGIKDGLALLETEDLKNYVRNIHLENATRRVSRGPSFSPGSTPYHRLADFNVLITAIIMQLLPDLATLTRLLGAWSLRLSILRQIPGFFEQLREAKLGIESAWTTLEQATRLGAGLVLTREIYGQIKQVLEDRVTKLAKSIDAILDSLEGQEDRIPDYWIDEVEEAESSYKDWVVEAERLVRLYEWQTSKLDKETVPIITNLEQIHHHNLGSVSVTKAMMTSLDESDALLLRSGHTATQSLQTTRQFEGESTPNPLDPIFDNSKGMVQEPKMLGIATKQVTSHVTRPLLPLRAGPSGNADFGTDDLSPVLSTPLEIGSSIEIAQELKPPRLHNNDNAIDGSVGYQVSEKIEETLVLSSTNHGVTDTSEHEHSLSDSEPTLSSNTPSSHSRIMLYDSETVVEAGHSTGQNLSPDISAQQQIENLQRELDEAPEDSEFLTQSPSLTVRKIRLPLEPHNTVSEPPNTMERTTLPMEDKMTAKISRLLTNIPAPIQLTIHPPRTGTEPGDERKYVTRPQQQPLSIPALTLSPVVTKQRGTKSNDAGVRVYHLHQSGKEVPIKLFIRLVGNEERVMVRVGGGWADLAEYLKEYAMHHGRRSVSNSNFELEGLPSAQNVAIGILETSQSPSSPITGTPTRRPITPQLDWTTESHTPESIGQAKSTPASSESYRVRPRSNLSVQEDDILSLGLGGPKSKKIELSPQKRAWVDGMLGQARQISSEYRKTEDIGDLGKVGNTKRVYLRGRSDSFTPK